MGRAYGNPLLRRAASRLLSYNSDCEELRSLLSYRRGLFAKSPSDFSSFTELGCHVQGGEGIPAIQRWVESEPPRVRRLENRISSVEGFMSRVVAMAARGGKGGKGKSMLVVASRSLMQGEPDCEVAEAIHADVRTVQRYKRVLLEMAVGVFGWRMEGGTRDLREGFELSRESA